MAPSASIDLKVLMIIRLGMLTPSSNTVIEPITVAMLARLNNVTAHFGRFRVTEIALSDRALGQFDDCEMLRAAELLAEAKVDVIAWNGTSASWLGFERDERLIERILCATGIKACTCVLAFREIFQRTHVKNIGLITPYTSDVQDRIKVVWGASGFRFSAERHLGIRDNFSFAQVAELGIPTKVAITRCAHSRTADRELDPLRRARGRASNCDPVHKHERSTWSRGLNPSSKCRSTTALPSLFGKAFGKQACLQIECTAGGGSLDICSDRYLFDKKAAQESRRQVLIFGPRFTGASPWSLSSTNARRAMADALASIIAWYLLTKTTSVRYQVD
jgi:maleate cis-trans isomerase